MLKCTRSHFWANQIRHRVCYAEALIPTPWVCFLQCSFQSHALRPNICYLTPTYKILQARYVHNISYGKGKATYTLGWAQNFIDHMIFFKFWKTGRTLNWHKGCWLISSFKLWLRRVVKNALGRSWKIVSKWFCNLCSHGRS